MQEYRSWVRTRYEEYRLFYFLEALQTVFKLRIQAASFRNVPVVDWFAVKLDKRHFCLGRRALSPNCMFLNLFYFWIFSIRHHKLDFLWTRLAIASDQYVSKEEIIYTTTYNPKKSIKIALKTWTTNDIHLARLLLGTNHFSITTLHVSR